MRRRVLYIARGSNGSNVTFVTRYGVTSCLLTSAKFSLSLRIGLRSPALGFVHLLDGKQRLIQRKAGGHHASNGLSNGGAHGCHSSGVRSFLLELHGLQAAVRFSSEVAPPRLYGWMWSQWRGTPSTPQYVHLNPSRSRTASRSEGLIERGPRAFSTSRCAFTTSANCCGVHPAATMALMVVARLIAPPRIHSAT